MFPLGNLASLKSVYKIKKIINNLSSLVLKISQIRNGKMSTISQIRTKRIQGSRARLLLARSMNKSMALLIGQILVTLLLQTNFKLQTVKKWIQDWSMILIQDHQAIYTKVNKIQIETVTLPAMAACFSIKDSSR